MAALTQYQQDNAIVLSISKNIQEIEVKIDLTSDNVGTHLIGISSGRYI